SPPLVLVSSMMLVLSIPAPAMVIAFIGRYAPKFHPFDQTDVPSGSCTVSPSCAARIASSTPSGVKSLAVWMAAIATLSLQRRDARTQTRMRAQDEKVTPWELNMLSSYFAEVLEEGNPMQIEN